MQEINIAALSGRVKSEPTLRQTKASGTPVLDFEIEQREGRGGEACVFECALFGSAAAEQAGLVREGALLFVEGRMSSRKWVDKATGRQRARTFLKVDTLRPAGGPA